MTLARLAGRVTGGSTDPWVSFPDRWGRLELPRSASECGWGEHPGRGAHIEGGYGTRRKGLPAAADRADCSLLRRSRGAQAGKHFARRA